MPRVDRRACSACTHAGVVINPAACKVVAAPAPAGAEPEGGTWPDRAGAPCSPGVVGDGTLKSAAVARWSICWLLLIATATAGAYWGTNVLVGVRGPVDQTHAMQPLGELGSTDCARAIAVLRTMPSAGSARAAWDHAARNLPESCAADRDEPEAQAVLRR